VNVLEFISSLKWPVVVLVLVGSGARAVKKHPGFGKWLREWFDRRNANLRFGPAEGSLTLPQETATAVRTATASDEQLAAPDPTGQRQEAVEIIMRDAARWGWQMAHRGLPSTLVPVIRWTDDGRPEILYGRPPSSPREMFVRPDPAE
jgi:hypothetical protein